MLHSVISQASTAPAVAIMVLKKASVAFSLAARAEPALKPNQPTHSSAAPTKVMGRVRLHGFAAVAHALADHIGADQAGHAGVDVHHRAAGEVQRARALSRPGAVSDANQTMWAMGT